MSTRVLRLSLAPPLVSLFFFSTSVVPAVIVTANCTTLLWTFNSHGQSPCIVAANMLSTCYAGIYSLAPLPPGYAYEGAKPQNSNYCECSTIGYSLISACVTCQERTPLTWSQYTTSCIQRLPPSMFPNPVPADTFVPHWAILDVTNQNNWNATESNAAGNGPEYGPGTIFGTEGPYTSSASTSSASTSSPSTSPTAPPTSHSGSHAGPIAGGVAGGIAAISIAVALIFYLQKRRRSQAKPASVDASQSALLPRPDNETDRTAALSSTAQTSATGLQRSSTAPTSSTGLQQSSTVTGPMMVMPVRLYDPNDPSTFPVLYQGDDMRYPSQDNPALATSQLAPPPHAGSGGTLADMQTSQPDDNDRRYHGFPMPSA